MAGRPEKIPEVTEKVYGNMIVVFKLKKCLREHNTTPYRFKMDVQTSQKTYANYATGESHQIDFELLDKWCQYLDCKLTDIIEFKEKE
ncbi:MAG: helix-turn-helix domain-containing protein [Oscillospiraceae bacterium]